MTVALPIVIFMTVLGIVALIIGVAAYLGKFQEWAKPHYWHTGAFDGVIIGVTFLYLFPFRPFAIATSILFGFINVPFILFFCCITGFFWLPSFMLPRWFKEGREARREIERTVRDVKRQARALRRENRSR